MRAAVIAAALVSGHSLADVIAVVVHAQDSSVDGEERPVEAQRHRAVKIFALLLGHLKDDLGRILDAPTLAGAHAKVNYVGSLPEETLKESHTLTYSSMLLMRMSISSLDHIPCFHL